MPKPSFWVKTYVQQLSAKAIHYENKNELRMNISNKAKVQSNTLRHKSIRSIHLAKWGNKTIIRFLFLSSDIY